MNKPDARQCQFLPSLGLLVFRLVMGSAFILHGMGKISNPMGWLGEGPTPPFMQAIAAYSEFGGGILLALGLLTPLAALAIMGTMVGALVIVHLPAGHPFVSATGGASFESALAYLSAAVLFLCNGAGKFSLDALFFKRFCNKNENACEKPASSGSENAGSENPFKS